MTTIRSANISDVEQILPLYVELHEFTAAGVPERLRVPNEYDDEAMSSYVTELLTDPSSACLLGTDGSQLVGLAEVHIVEPEHDPAVVPARRAHLQSLLVTKQRRGEGFGTRLLAAGEWAKKQGAAEIELDHWVFQGDPGRFYESAGYGVIRKTLTRSI